MSRSVANVLALALLAACKSDQAVPPDSTAPALDDMFDAAFRQVIAAIPPSMLEGADVICIAGPGGGDPSPSVMRRLANHRPPLKPLSQCLDHGTRCCSGSQQLVSTRSIGLGVFRYVGNESAEFTVYLDVVDSLRSQFRITRRKGSWTVEQIDRAWFS